MGGAEPGGSSYVVDQTETYGGYDCVVEQPPSDSQTECPICQLVFRDPYRSKCCGNSFCCSCGKRIQALHKPCPICRNNKFELSPNERLKCRLNQCHVLCRYGKGGCEWCGKLEDLDQHLSEVVHSGELFQHEGVYRVG